MDVINFLHSYNTDYEPHSDDLTLRIMRKAKNTSTNSSRQLEFMDSRLSL